MRGPSISLFCFFNPSGIQLLDCRSWYFLTLTEVTSFMPKLQNLNLHTLYPKQEHSEPKSYPQSWKDWRRGRRRLPQLPGYGLGPSLLPVQQIVMILGGIYITIRVVHVAASFQPHVYRRLFPCGPHHTVHFSLVRFSLP